MITCATALVTAPVTIFLIVMAIILLAPVILNKLKIPHIIGMIVAGVVVGPYGLNILDRDSSFTIFGQVGLLYLMFLAGLEIDMYHLRRNIRKGVVFGLLTFFIPMVMGVLASVYILHVSWLTSFLLASMYASHTLIAYPVAARFGIPKAPSVIIAVVGALLVLAGAVNIFDTGEFHSSGFLWLFTKLALYCAAVLYAYPRLTRRFFKQYSDKVTQYVFVMVMLFLSAWVSGAIGLEPVLGAFFAGLVLNRYIPANSPLMNSIEFVGNALFIPYFLIGVGMMINVGVIARGNTLAVAGVMLAVALASKWLAAWIAQITYGMDGADRRMMFGLTTAHTAVALAVVTIGYNMILPDGSRMIDETILNGTVLVILVTCAIAPMFTSQAASRIKIRMLEGVSQTDVEKASAVHMLIPVANPITSASLMELGLMMRLRHEGINADTLYALHVRNDNSPAAKAIGENSLRLAIQAAAGADVPVTPIERFDINTVTGILNTVQERDINCIVIGMHRKTTVIDSFLGAKIEQLLKGTNHMVVISRCYIPLNTVTRIVVFVPANAEYETGFRRWVLALGHLASEIGCRIIFCTNERQQPIVRSIIRREALGIRHEYRTVLDKDDFVLLANRVLDDDLFVVIGARPNSVSYSSDMVESAMFLQRYFNRYNLCMIYPEQFGEEPASYTFTDPLGSDIVTTASPLWLAVRSRLQKLNALKKRLTHRRRSRRQPPTL